MDKDPNDQEKVFFKIIVPNYNNMAYIKKCLDSILEQTFQDFKIIIVDDISTDLSDKFCEMYARKYPDKIVFHRLEKKGYAGACRNWGLKYQIDCDYILFVDSDDWMYDIYGLHNIYNLIINENHKPDIIRLPLYHFYGKNSNNNYISNDKFNNVENILKNGCGPSKNCIKSTFSNILFKEDRAKNNDVIWCLKLFDNTKLNIKQLLTNPIICYNRISITSCQNNQQMISSNHCINAVQLLNDDLLQETFYTNTINNVKSWFIKTYIPKMLSKSIKFNVNDVMTNSYCISIDKDKYLLFNKIFTKCGFKILPKLMHGISNTNYKRVINCKNSHLSVIKHAKKYNLPYVLIFEDDAYPCNNIIIEFQKYLNAIPDNAHLILFGWSSYSLNFKHYGKQSFNLMFNPITNSKISGAHAYMVFNRAYDKYINLMDNSNLLADNDIFKLIEQSYIIDKPLFIQFNKNKSMNNHIGYILYGDHDNPPKNFNKIETYL